MNVANKKLSYENKSLMDLLVFMLRIVTLTSNPEVGSLNCTQDNSFSAT